MKLRLLFIAMNLKSRMADTPAATYAAHAMNIAVTFKPSKAFADGSLSKTAAVFGARIPYIQCHDATHKKQHIAAYQRASLVNIPVGIKTPNIERNPKDTTITVTGSTRVSQKHLPQFEDIVTDRPVASPK